MELNEFIERFLPDYENRTKRTKEYQNTLLENDRIISKYTEITALFPEALENFSNKICEKQRENCCEYAKGIDFSYGNNSCELLEVEQPKIEEL